MKTIAIIGGGTMGSGIAHVFAQNEYHVRLIDLSIEILNKSIAEISSNLDRMLLKQLITNEVKEATLSNIELSIDLEKSVKNVDLVIEAVSENLTIKKEIFKKLDTHSSPHTILASNTSSISISEIATATSRPEKVIGMHFMNPVPLMDLVEVINGKKTTPIVTKTIMELATKLDKIPIEANDYPGFVANRILMPMLNEAIQTLEHKVAGVKEIDTVMKLGMGHPMGPLQLADYIGLDICLSILNVLYKGFNDLKYKPCELLMKMVGSGDYGIKSGKGFYDYSNSSKAEIVAPQFS